uniref:PRE_C2HC domain-containing protein n=1 Tax=Heterorhabditis bacteriophora TaxID=37862 RepID=A0A1I7W954_HETBA
MPLFELTTERAQETPDCVTYKLKLMLGSIRQNNIRKIKSVCCAGQHTSSDMFKSYQHLLRICRQLQSLGDDIDNTTYAQIIETRFPKSLMSKVIPKIKIHPITAQVLLDKIGEVLNQEAAIDRIYDDNRRIQFSIKPDYKPNRFPTLYKHTNDHADRDTMPSSTFSAATSTRNIECAYCHNKSHKSSACKAYPMIDSRKKRSMELRLCLI